VHRADDYPQVWQADSEGWLDPPGTTAAWVAEVDGRIAGHVSLISDAEGLKLSRLFVGPFAQRQGLARRLMAVAVAWGRDRGMDVVLEVFAESPAVTVYERLGWRYLASGQASWTGRDGSAPAVHYYAAPAS
jgi:GNAT superfamily N-acetyltransferase